MSNDVYYRIYLNHTNLVTVVCMQSLDEDDYNQNKFFRDEAGEAVWFGSEQEAVLFLNQKIREDKINPEYLSPNNTSFLR